MYSIVSESDFCGEDFDTVQAARDWLKMWAGYDDHGKNFAIISLDKQECFFVQVKAIVGLIDLNY